MNEFKPCPFCGVNDWQYHSHFSGATIRQCGECGTIIDESIINTRPTEDALNSRIVELKTFIGQLIEAGNAVVNTYPTWVHEEDKWDDLVKDWKEG